MKAAQQRGSRRGVNNVGGIDVACVRLPCAGQWIAGRGSHHGSIGVNVPVHSAIAERDIESAVIVTKRIARRASGAIQQHRKTTAVSEIAIQVSIESADDLQSDTDGIDLGDLRRKRSNI